MFFDMQGSEMNPNKELLQALIDGKTVQYQYLNPPESAPGLKGYWIDLGADLSMGFNHAAVHQMLAGESIEGYEFAFRVIE